MSDTQLEMMPYLSFDVHIPFKKQFWGDWHGNFKDRFGIRWMVNCSK
jgi:uncharacterized glyoxalase superfamily protein PhnB